jgi:hypothetical protein
MNTLTRLYSCQTPETGVECPNRKEIMVEESKKKVIYTGEQLTLITLVGKDKIPSNKLAGKGILGLHTRLDQKNPHADVYDEQGTKRGAIPIDPNDIKYINLCPGDKYPIEYKSTSSTLVIGVNINYSGKCEITNDRKTLALTADSGGTTEIAILFLHNGNMAKQYLPPD